MGRRHRFPRLAEGGDEPSGVAPVRVQRFFGRVEGHRSEPVLADLQAGRQGAGEAVGGEDVEVPVLDEGRYFQDVEQLPDTGWYGLAPGTASSMTWSWRTRT